MSRPQQQHVKDLCRSPALPDEAPALPASQSAADRSTSPFAQLPKSPVSPTGVLLLTDPTADPWEHLCQCHSWECLWHDSVVCVHVIWLWHSAAT